MSMNMRRDEMVLTLDGVFTDDQVADVLRAGGVPALSVEFVGSDWPHMVTFVVRMAEGAQRGVVTFECVFSPGKIEQTATVRIVEDDGGDDDGDGMPPGAET
jgi:hypothetical protein